MQYAIMNSSYATQATVMQCLFLKGYLHVVSDSENKTSMIRLQSPQIFMWRLFRWRRKWLIAKKDLSSSAVDGLAMNSFQTYTTFAAYFNHDTITSAECQRWHSTLCRLQKYLTTTTTKERESVHLLWWTCIHCIIQLCKEASVMSPSC